jgi:5-methylcytosine-specific restriction endonuclease McrA
MYATNTFYRERILALKQAGYDLEKDSINLKRRLRWLKDPNNPARLYYRRKDIKNRTPKWAKSKSIQRELLRIYAACPIGMEVDHIIPLKGIIDGREVWGLHIPWNLQYLSPTENRKKKNLISEKDIIGL